MRPSVQGPPDQTTCGRDHSLGRAPGMSGQFDGRARNPFDPVDALAAAWNRIGQAVRPIGRPPGDFHRPPDQIAVASGRRPECRRIPRTGPTDRTAPPLIMP